MSDSFIPQFTPQPASKDPAQNVQRDNGVRAELVRAPNEVRQEVREAGKPVRIRGEVQGQNPDGSTRIRTERGDVDVRLPDTQASPQPGQRVEIQIPPQTSPPQDDAQSPNQPAPQPQQVTVRTESVPAAPPPTEAQTAPPERVSLETPVRVEVTRQDTQEPIPVRIIPLEPGQEIRLLPLSPTLETQVTQPIAQLIEAQANIIPPQTTPVIATTPPPASALTIPPPQFEAAILPNVPQPALTLSQQQPVIQLVGQRIPAALPDTIQPVLQNVIAPSSGTITTTPGQPPATPLPVTTSVLTPPPLPIALGVPPDTPPTIPQPLTGQGALSAEVVKTAPPEIAFITPDTPRDAPSAPLAQPSPILQGSPQTNTATIIGFIEQNLPVVQFTLPGAPFDPAFVLQTENNTLPVGTQIQVSTQTLNTLPQAQILPGLPVPAAFLTPENWPVMEQLYQSIARAAPQVAQAMANVTPNPANPAQLGPAALFFIAAVRAGDMNGWLGNKAADILRSEGKGNLLTRLGQEGSPLSRLAAEPVSPDWRGISLPLFYQGEIQKIALYYKQDQPRQDDDEQKEGQTRFLMNLDLSRIGKLQLDGLARGKKLDLAIRTQQRFSNAMQMDMRGLYTNALETMGFSGGLSFQNNPESWVHINVNKDLYKQDI